MCALASLRSVLRAMSIAHWSPKVGLWMVASILLRIARRAAAIFSPSLLRSVSHTAAWYRDFQSEFNAPAGIGEIVAQLAVGRNSSKGAAVGRTPYLRSMRDIDSMTMSAPRSE